MAAPITPSVAPGRRRIGVIGLGMASAPHAQSLIDLRDRVEVAGCFSPSAERRAAFAARHGLPTVDRMEALLEDPTLSAVLLLTPPDSHDELVARCAAARKLLHLAFAVVSKRQPFDPAYQTRRLAQRLAA